MTYFSVICVRALKSKKINVKRADPSFGKMQRLLKKYKAFDCHKEAVQVSITLPACCADVGEMLSSQHAQQAENRDCLLKILANLKFLARQGLPQRGDGRR